VATGGAPWGLFDRIRLAPTLGMVARQQRQLWGNGRVGVAKLVKAGHSLALREPRQRGWAYDEILGIRPNGRRTGRMPQSLRPDKGVRFGFRLGLRLTSGRVIGRLDLDPVGMQRPVAERLRLAKFPLGHFGGLTGI
jgi:hypothetical protein